MKKESILYGVVGLLAGLLVAGATATIAVNNDNHSMMRMMGMNTDHTTRQEVAGDGGMSMAEAAEQIKNKSGDDFDMSFIDSMIAHHEGAIEMATFALTNAKHDEIKQMARDIISAQSKEIDMMREWQVEWGYKDASPAHDMEDM